jgi:hypothetical protein
MKSLYWYLNLFLVLVPISGCAEEVIVPTSWKPECIGRYTIALPSEVNIAMQSEKTLTKGKNASNSGAEFNNGDYEGRASIYVDGSIEVSQKVDDIFFENYKKKAMSLKNDRLKVQRFLNSSGNGYNTDWIRGASALIFLNNQIFTFELHTDGKLQEDLMDAKKKRGVFLRDFTYRKIFELPEQNGVCIPYGFIKDKGEMYRDVGVAMRLINHPDIEIFFKEGNASNGQKDILPQFKGSRGEVEYFWSYYGPSVGNQLQGTLNHYYDIKLGGYTGKYAFATIARSTDPNEPRSKEDETVSDYKARVKKEIADGKRPLDYGFMAYYKGDPSKTDEPDLMLYVIRTASRAIAAGKQPVSEEELKTMALQIAASIQRRKVD